MRNLIILFFLFITTTLPAQFSIHLEQAVGISDDVRYQPIGVEIDYRIAALKSFDFSVGLAYNRIALEEKLTGSQEIFPCGILGCFPTTLTTSFVRSNESRLALPLGISRTSDRFTYGIQLRPSYRFSSDVRFPTPDNQQIVETKFGEDIPVSEIFIDSGNYRVDKTRFSLQVGTNFQYALTERFSFGLNYRYEGLLNNDILIIRHGFYGAPPARTEYFRGRSQVHYLVATVGWRL
jgi:hypothetical protein